MTPKDNVLKSNIMGMENNSAQFVTQQLKLCRTFIFAAISAVLNTFAIGHTSSYSEDRNLYVHIVR